MSNVWQGGGHLTVQRDLDGDDSLVEVWELEHLAWSEDAEPGEYGLLKHWVADVNDVPSDGVPHSGDAVSAMCEFDKAPVKVRESFIDQAIRLRDAVSVLEQGDDGDE